MFRLQVEKIKQDMFVPDLCEGTTKIQEMNFE